MAVHQVEEYYVWLPKLNISEETESALSEKLTSKGVSSFEITSSELMVLSNIKGKMKAKKLDEELMKIIKGNA